MYVTRFDAVVRSLSEGPSRRGLLGGIAATVLGLTMALHAESAVAKDGRRKNKKADGGNKRKKRKKRRNGQNGEPPQSPAQPQFNEFGCVDVGQLCFGRSDLCCSGRCEGTPPQPGEPDQRTCAAHNTGACTPEFDSCLSGINVECANGGVCHLTTGKGAFCGASEDGECTVCAKDTDCEPEFGPGAACVVCAAICGAAQPTGCVPPSV